MTTDNVPDRRLAGGLEERALRDHGLTVAEYGEIVRLVGHPPNRVELGIFGVMWSEHCAYKSSRAHFKHLPTTGPRVVQGPGENAGAVHIGLDREGRRWAAVFKMESHNHPSFIEPVQGAATGVGGILRDVFTMGARPVALLDGLRFGTPESERTRQLVAGVVRGISSYGNCVGVPTVGGDASFDPSFDGNVLVNVLALGIVREDRLFRGAAAGAGNPVLYIGSRTGRDGIHGATMASAGFDSGNAAPRPTVQVGDPLAEKQLLEASLEIFANDWIVGAQDMGAAGLTSSSFEMAARSGAGLRLDLDRVPLRAGGMTPYEILLSESQERMLMVARRGHEEEVAAVCRRWGLEVATIGEVTGDGRFTACWQGETVADLPVEAVVGGAPSYDRKRLRPGDLDARRELPVADVRDVSPQLARDLWLALMGDPDVASKRWIYEQFDHSVRTNTLLGPGAADAAVLRVKELGDEGERIALSVDCPSRYGFADPWSGGVYAVAEAARNVACVGAEPVALTDCLNFGSPERSEVMWSFVQAIRGVGDAARALATPVVGGNVSLYNEHDGHGILPTPMVGMLGVLPAGVRPTPLGFQSPGHGIFLVGRFAPSLGASLYVSRSLGRHAGRPSEPDLVAERALCALLREGAAAGLLESAHDLSDGGLAVALAECAVASGLGCKCRLEVARGTARIMGAERGRLDTLLFGETGASAVVTCARGRTEELLALAAATYTTCVRLGTVGDPGDDITLGHVAISLAEARDAHGRGFAHALGFEGAAQNVPAVVK